MNIITTESKYEDFFLKDYKNNKFSILYFTASWCGPCKRMYPLVIKIIEELKIDYFKFYKIDIDDNDEIVESFKISGVPTFILLYNNEILNEFSGCDILKFKDMLLIGKNKYKDITTIKSNTVNNNGDK
jgi:thioredoxin 1